MINWSKVEIISAILWIILSPILYRNDKLYVCLCVKYILPYKYMR